MGELQFNRRYILADAEIRSIIEVSQSSLSMMAYY